MWDDYLFTQVKICSYILIQGLVGLWMDGSLLFYRQNTCHTRSLIQSYKFPQNLWKIYNYLEWMYMIWWKGLSPLLDDPHLSCIRKRHSVLTLLFYHYIGLFLTYKRTRVCRRFQFRYFESQWRNIKICLSRDVHMLLLISFVFY